MRILIAFLPVFGLWAQPGVQPIPATPHLPAQPIPNYSAVQSPIVPPVPPGNHYLGGPTQNGFPPVATVAAQYTAEARAAGLQGTVSLYVAADVTGVPHEVRVMQGLGLGLDQAARRAVEQSNFKQMGAFEVQVPFRLETPTPWSVEREFYQSSAADLEVTPPSPVQYVAPNAAACREASTVRVRFHVGADGVPRSVYGEKSGGDAAVKAVEQWRFSPASSNGKNLEADGWVEFDCAPGGVKPAVADKVYRVGGTVTAPILLAKFEPEYTPAARRDGVQGDVILYVQISPQGRAEALRVEHSLGAGLDEKAMECVKKWRFRPGMENGHPVEVEATIEVHFQSL